MQTITKTFNIYNFDELAQDIKEQLIKKECEISTENYCDYYLEEDMKEKAKELIKKAFGDKAIYKNTHYSFSYCQGDGAMIEFDLVYYGKKLSIKHNNYCRYYHETSFEIIENDIELTEKQYNNLMKKIISINEKLANYGHECIEEDRTEQAIEQLKDYMFYENGDIY